MSDPSLNVSKGVSDEQCILVCKNNATNVASLLDGNLVRLEFMTQHNGAWIRDIAKRFEDFKNGNVEIDVVVVPFSKLNEEIINSAVSKIAVYDGYVTPPTIAGSIVEYNGWADLTPFIQESASNIEDWSDILIGYRQHVAFYRGQNIMYPLDGDLLSLYYRKDVLAYYGLKVPRTWDEYNQVAAATHGKVFENQTLSGYVHVLPVSTNESSRDFNHVTLPCSQVVYRT
jgi:multiple sugar transport system substrate-binding protein